jgi:ParB-like nuclease family protein
MEFVLDDLELDSLLLDPNNYRFLDLPQWKRRLANRFHEPGAQEATLKFMENTARYNLPELRDSILSNGYISLERIVVTPYQHSDGKYIVVEGNRRVAALKTLLRDSIEGVLTLTDQQTESFSKIPVAILNPSENLQKFQRIIMGIRHIAGPQEWGAYQQATLILQLLDEEGQDYNTISKHIGLSLNETRRRYRAIKALSVMQNDEVYSSAARPKHYRLFHELVSLPKVREFFSWDHDNACFKDIEKARVFFEFIEPLEPERPTKINTYLDIRHIRDIIGNGTAESILLDFDRTLADALVIVTPQPTQQTSAELMDIANRFLSAIDGAQIDCVASLSQDDVSTLEEIIDTVSSRIEQYNKLSK